MSLVIKTKINDDENSITYSLSGELDINTADSLKESILSQHKTVKKLIFDFTNVNFVDSTGLGVLVNIKKQLIDVEVSVVNQKDHILKLFRITGLSRYF